MSDLLLAFLSDLFLLPLELLPSFFFIFKLIYIKQTNLAEG